MSSRRQTHDTGSQQLHKKSSQVSDFEIDKPEDKRNGLQNKETKKMKIIHESVQKQQQSARTKPLSTSLSKEADFSACLLIKDDNEILGEWLAYHYHTIKLRHLIVAVDPSSRQSPRRILTKWSLMTDLKVREWNDADFMPPEFLATGMLRKGYKKDFMKDFMGKNLTEGTILKIARHRYRQRIFLATCFKTFRMAGSTWVMHIVSHVSVQIYLAPCCAITYTVVLVILKDTDEYIVPSKRFREMNSSYVSLPSMEEPNAVLRLLQQVVLKTRDAVNYPCISMLRTLFGSFETKDDGKFIQTPLGFNAYSFETLRWRFHALPNNTDLHGNPKVIVDVSAIPEKHLRKEVFSIHRPMPEFCRGNKDLVFNDDFRKQPISVNHYLGSWERYNARQDERRSRSIYNMKASANREIDDGIIPWLKGFVQSMGFRDASKLLDGAYLINDTEKV